MIHAGNLIDLEPMTLVYVQMWAMFTCLSLFSVGAILGRNIVKRDREAAKLDASEEQEELKERLNE